MLNPRRVLIATMLTAGLVSAMTLPAAAETSPSPTPTATATATPKPTVTPTQAPTVAKNTARNITITYVSKTVARLTWTAPSDAQGQTVHYYVRVAGTLGGKALTARVTNDTTARSLTLRNVRPGSMLVPEVTTKYRKARGRTDKGNAYTQNQVVPSKPTGVTVKIKNGSADTKPSATVTFKAPSTSGNNGTLIDGYRVRIYDASNDKVAKTETLGSGDRSSAITGLAFGKTYYAKVAAHNSAGYGSEGKSAEVATGASPTPTPTATATPTLTPLIQIPLPPVPTPKPTLTPTKTATPVPTATTVPTPSITSTPATKPGVFRNASDTTWFTISLIVAVGVGILLSIGTFVYYRLRRRR